MKTFKIAIFVAVAVALVFGGIWYNHNLDNKAQQQESADQAAAAQAQAQAQADILSKFKVTDVTVGTGSEAKNGNTVTVNYTGTLDDGTIFDSNTNAKFQHVQPFSFTLGQGQVIQGWDLGVAGMKVGGKRTLVIPPELGYGGQAVGSIPANSTLHFTVELLSVK
ncbi:MAG: FKBP-type peptidyl-prolyl cis-trans isomerase [Patescibacteria group bacterium]|nr:FKBP-type peptidyl-prolyl cis-trans isomerase [Patescibacteria group bacterium]MDE2015783.1 FKBP-type peptidyl-prolyl cis-trans isomerase [Patescibacteria group bacterium]MDE2226840.1 FKBP-type peptidyl-prolyl cis-trans isomerase [Patescibacteria group bacterium]